MLAYPVPHPISVYAFVTNPSKRGCFPYPCRDKKSLGFKPRDKVALTLDHDVVRLEPVPSALKAGFGAVKPRRKPEDFKELPGKVRGGLFKRQRRSYR